MSEGDVTGTREAGPLDWGPTYPFVEIETVPTKPAHAVNLAALTGLVPIPVTPQHTIDVGGVTLPTGSAVSATQLETAIASITITGDADIAVGGVAPTFQISTVQPINSNASPSFVNVSSTSPTPTTAQQLTRKDYVDTSVAAAVNNLNAAIAATEATISPSIESAISKITITGDADVIAAGTAPSFNISTSQPINASASPSFVQVSATASMPTAPSHLARKDYVDASIAALPQPSISVITGTPDEIIVVGPSAGQVALQTPQPIAPTSSPTFNMVIANAVNQPGQGAVLARMDTVQGSAFYSQTATYNVVAYGGSPYTVVNGIAFSGPIVSGTMIVMNQATASGWQGTASQSTVDTAMPMRTGNGDPVMMYLSSSNGFSALFNVSQGTKLQSRCSSFAITVVTKTTGTLPTTGQMQVTVMPCNTFGTLQTFATPALPVDVTPKSYVDGLLPSYVLTTAMNISEVGASTGSFAYWPSIARRTCGTNVVEYTLHGSLLGTATNIPAAANADASYYFPIPFQDAAVTFVDQAVGVTASWVKTSDGTAVTGPMTMIATSNCFTTGVAGLYFAGQNGSVFNLTGTGASFSTMGGLSALRCIFFDIMFTIRVTV